MQVPENITLDQAASVPLGLATVTTGLWGHHPNAKSISLAAPWEEGGQTKYVGKAAVILGGASSVGQYGTPSPPFPRSPPPPMHMH